MRSGQMFVMGLVGMLVLVAIASNGWAENGAWTISAGADYRRVSSDFDMSVPSWDGVNAGPRRSSDGELGLVTLQDFLFVPQSYSGYVHEYADGGFVQSPSFWQNWAGASALVDDPSQVGVNPDSYSGVRMPVRDVTFHSYAFDYKEQITPGQTHADDNDNVFSPWLAVSYSGLPFLNGKGLFRIQYTPIRAEGHSGSCVLSSRRVLEHKNTYAYTYDVGEAPMDEIQGGEPDGNSWILIYDADTFNSFPAAVNTGEQLQNPRSSESLHTTVVSDEAWVGDASMTMWQHELALTAEYPFELLSFLDVAVALGPTLNLCDTDLDYELRLKDLSTHSVISRTSSSEDDLRFRVGAMAEVNFRATVCKQCGVFVFGGAGYHWMPSYTVSTGQSSVEIDTSSFVASAGVGIRL